MFCPEDGTEITMSRSDAVTAYYPPCEECDTVWIYNGDQGVYEQGPEPEDTPEIGG